MRPVLRAGSQLALPLAALLLVLMMLAGLPTAKGSSSKCGEDFDANTCLWLYNSNTSCSNIRSCLWVTATLSGTLRINVSTIQGKLFVELQHPSATIVFPSLLSASADIEIMGPYGTVSWDCDRLVKINLPHHHTGRECGF